MGVTGLWKLIEPCGQPVPVEMLENKVLAIDISIWLHQVVKGFQDKQGSALANSHLLGLFHRLCKLMYYRIKPVFVFDGKVPLLKRETIAKRNQRRNKLVNEADRIQTLLLQSLAKEKVVQQALGSKATDELLKASPSKSRISQKCADVDMFKLPDMPKNEFNANDIEEDIFDPCETKSRISHNQNLQAIDVKSEHFRNLPADIRHEILIDIKETRKQSSWGKLHELPSKSNEFSTFQMKRLLKRRQVQEGIEEVEKEMDGVRTFTISELENIFSEEGIIETPELGCTKQISSDANTRYLLIRDLKETLANAGSGENNDKLKASSIDPKTQKAHSSKADIEDADLEMAIKMSLDDSAPYSENDYRYRKEGRKLNSEQRSLLKNANVGIARDFMIEHACMNDEDVRSLLESTQTDDEFHYESGLLDNNLSMNTATETSKAETNVNSCIASEKSLELINTKGILQNDSTKILKSPKTPSESEEIGIMSDTNSDSELEEVNDITPSNNIISNSELLMSDSKIKMEIFVDLTKSINKEEDIFADVFKSTEEKSITPKQSSLNVANILQDLKKQAVEATKINLSDIKLNTPIIEISDDESLRLSQKLVYDTDSDSSQNIVAELIPNSICDEKSLSENQSFLESDNVQKAPGSDGENLPLVKKTECSEVIEIVNESLSKKSSTNVTPSKTKDISNFFETKFIVKRTPEKKDGWEDVPKVTPPFFVRKSPKSSNEKTHRKRCSVNHDDSPVKKSHKVNKMLFENNFNYENSPNENEIVTKYNEQDALELAANALKEQKSTEELEDMVSKLAKEKIDLEKERNRQDRMGMTITEKMNSECMELLRLFGVPFIVAPMEAEAQCAFLDSIKLTNGTITDDSDIWLFGGRTVYKNFFAQNKHVMEFKYDTIQSSFNVDRNKLIQLALLVGSDYTTGINGIGTVTALEILANFSPKEITEINPSQQTTTVLASLQKFREWWTSTKTNTIIGSSIKHRLRNKLANIEVYEEFPSSAVAEAYLKPEVDNNQNSFSWGKPDVESIREFARTNLGWTRNKTDEILGPILKKLNEKTSQSTITNYFSIKSVSSTKQMAVSKRVQNAINCMSADFKPNEELETTKGKTRRKKLQGETSDKTNAEILSKKSRRVNRKNVNLPTTSTSETIPQRQKDQEEMEQKKKLAAEKFKQSKQKCAKK